MSSDEGSRGKSALREEMDELKGNVQELKDLMLRTLQQQQQQPQPQPQQQPRDPSQLGNDVRSMSPPRRPPVSQRSFDPTSPHPGAAAAAAPSSPPHRAVSEAVPSEGTAAAARGRSSAAQRSAHTHAEDSLSMPEDEEDATPSRPGHTRPPTSPLLHDSFSSPPHHALHHGSVPPSLASVGALSPPSGASPLGLNFGAYRDVQTAQQLQRSVRSRPSTGATVSPYVGGLVAVDSEATLCNRHASPPRQPAGTPPSVSGALSRLPSPKEIDDHIEGILSGTVVVTATAPCPPPVMGDALVPATGELNSFWLRCSSNAFDLSRKNAVGFYGRRLGDVVGQSLREILLQVGCRVESVDVGCTDLTNRGVEALAQGLAAATAATVTEVKLNGNPLVGDVGLAALMAKLPSSVRTLEIGDCGLTHHAGALIAAQLPRLPLLKELHVFCNPDLGDRGAAHFASAVSGGHSFDVLDLQGCNISSSARGWLRSAGIRAIF